MPHRPKVTDAYALHRARPTWVRYNEYRPDASALAVEGLPE
ncbi:MAG TPA: hypothetical protein PKX10_05560 [Propioniciclava tarda]|nr:hypothetical protein [Propioniciclava tarda]HQA30872.1 hypothetical protein [Propioniciclava tarda]HQD60994.1 hypothetical protein [Propioniciclava tarda]